MRQRRYSLRHGLRREPRVAFQRKRRGANKELGPYLEYKSRFVVRRQPSCPYENWILGLTR